MKRQLLTAIILVLFLHVNAQHQPQLQLELHASGLEEPVDIANAGDKRLFVVEKDGIIKIVNADGEVSPTPFLDIDDKVNSAANERGLLGLVFHPDYQNNGYFYVNYTNLNGTTHISRFNVSDDADVADPESETILMAIPQLSHTHNGGDLNFGPDGYLYIATGDGGMSGDPFNRAQNRQVALGKVLRIDVDNPSNGLNYGIPSDNPFINDTTTLDEIWALGLRNPWRFSFDRSSGDMWIADVGQDELEEINFQAAASTGGENYGWRCYEGDMPFNQEDCADASTYTMPIHTYINSFSVGCSVTGGFVYRGTAEPELYGHYIYADFCTGRFWSIYPDGNGGWTNANVGDFVDDEFTTFGENKDGELYVAAYVEGKIYRLTEICSNIIIDLTVTDESCEDANDGTIDMTILNAALPYNIEWSTMDTSEDLAGLSSGTYSVTVTDANDCVSIETTDVNTDILEAPIVTPLETVACEGDTITLTASEAPEGYGYQWFDAFTDEPVKDATMQTLTLTEGFYEVHYVRYIGDCPSDTSLQAIVRFNDVPTPTITLGSDGSLSTWSYNYVEDTYTWLLNDELASVELCITEPWCILPDVNGEYTVCIGYSLYGAFCSSCSEPFIYDLISNTENIRGLNDIQISPIPVDDVLHINLELSERIDLTIQLQNTQGQILIEKEEIVAGTWTTSLNVSDLPSGVYLLTLRSGDGISTTKIVK